MEEYLAARVWLMTSGWFPVKTRKVKFDCLQYKIVCPVFGLKKPEGKSDESIFAELEREALNILCPRNKEYDFFVAICFHQKHINRCLHEMGVSYETWHVPVGPKKRSRSPGNINSDVPGSKKSESKVATESSSVLPADSKVKAIKKPVSRQSTRQPEAQKKKMMEQGAGEMAVDLGSSSFMKDLQDTEGIGSWVLDGRRWSMCYDLNQFGTMDAGIGGRRVVVAEAMVALHCRKVVNLVDEDSKKEEDKSLVRPLGVVEVGAGTEDDPRKSVDGEGKKEDFEKSRSPSLEAEASEDGDSRQYDDASKECFLLNELL